MFKLRFSKDKIKHYSSLYDYKKENHIVVDIAPRIQKNKYLTKKDLIDICDWKTARTRSRVASNEPAFVKEVTRIAFATKSEKLKIEILTLLEEVSWPTASVILHFGTNFKYPY